MFDGAPVASRTGTGNLFALPPVPQHSSSRPPLAAGVERGGAGALAGGPGRLYGGSLNLTLSWLRTVPSSFVLLFPRFSNCWSCYPTGLYNTQLSHEHVSYRSVLSAVVRRRSIDTRDKNDYQPTRAFWPPNDAQGTSAEPLVGAGSLDSQFEAFERVVAQHPTVWEPSVCTKAAFAKGVNWVRRKL